jgi:rubrerythrin
MSDKPTYLGLLNAVALAEGRAHAYLRAWAAKTPSDDVRTVLLTVAAREGEHAASFAKRINELGFELRGRDDGELDDAIAIVTSERSDLEKMKALKLHRLDTGDKPDVFDDFFRDHTIDVRTGELLGRYIAEERDSARLLRSCYEQLKRAARATPSGPALDADEVGDAIDALEGKVDALCRSVDELRQVVCAQTMPAGAA